MLRAGGGRGIFKRATAAVAASGPGAFTPASLFAASENGFVLSGFVGGSSIYEESAKTTPATTSGTSPVGAITDVSGLGNDAIQSGLSSLRPVYYIDGAGIRSWRRGYIDGNNKWLDLTTPIYTTTQMCVVSVYKYLTQDDNGAAIITAYLGTNEWGTGGYLRIAMVPNVPNNRLSVIANLTAAQQYTTGPTIDSAAAIMRWDRSGLGTNQSVCTTYDEAGAQIATSTDTQDANPDNRISVGYNGAIVCGEIEECFLLVRDKPLSSDEWTDLSAWLIEQIGAGW